MSIFPNGKRERGLIAYLQGLAYRVTMRVAHRYNWHYAPPSYPERDTLLWCHWCGFRQITKRGGYEKVNDQAKICAVCEPQEHEAGDGR